ncbi:MAG TPA: hypothetical protein VIL44_06945 [Micromonospora sp.]
MSILRPGDEDMHYCDGSHRWAAPPSWGGDQTAWEERVREHQRQHQQQGSRAASPSRFSAESRESNAPRIRTTSPTTRQRTRQTTQRASR